MKKVNFFLVGYPKCGTTAIYQTLKDHPQIFNPKIKEPTFFAKDFREESDRINKDHKYYKIRTLKQYEEIYKEAKEKIIPDFTPEYILSEVAIQDIKKYNKNARILIIIREPVSFLKSVHGQNISVGAEPERNFFKALKLEQYRRKNANKFKNIKLVSRLFYSNFTQYNKQIKRVLDNFSSDKIKIIIYEDFKEDNIRTYKEIFNFLEIDLMDVQPKVVNVRRNPRNVKLSRFLSSGIFFKMYNKFPKKMKTKLKRMYNFTLFSNKSQKSDKNKELKLRKTYVNEIKLLDNLLIRNKLLKKEHNLINKWGYDKL